VNIIRPRSTNNSFGGGGSVSEEVQKARTLGMAVALGAALGAAMGAATGHMGVWVGAGIAIYIAISVTGGAWKRDRN
jgi:hypothetical protein